MPSGDRRLAETLVKQVGLATAAEAVRRAGLAFVDMPSTGQDPIATRPPLLAIGARGESFVIDRRALPDLGPLATALGKAVLVGHDIRHALAALGEHDGVSPAAVQDTRVLSLLIDGGLRQGDPHSFDTVCAERLGLPLGPKVDLRTLGDGPVPAQAVRRLSSSVAAMPSLFDILREEADREGLAKVARLEHDLLPAVVAMRLAGLRVDAGRWSELVNREQDRAQRLESDVRRTLGVANANAQAAVLAALKRRHPTITGTGKDDLAPFVGDPAVAALLELRSVSAFVRGLGSHVLEALGRHRDGRVRGDLDPMAAPTGRFGCAQPNLLALPKRGEIGRAVRRCIVPGPGMVFVDADYSAIELRVLADITRDETLCRDFDAGTDIHRTMAAFLLGVAEDEVTPDQRQAAKAVGFGFVYGMGPDGFVEHALTQYGLTISRADAAAYRTAYLRRHRTVRDWQDETRSSKWTEVRTASGRMRRFPEGPKAYTQRLNTPVQGTAADGFKCALVLLHERLPALGARVVLPPHDEVLVEAPREGADEVAEVVRETMVTGMTRFVRRVPIVVDVKVMGDWAGGRP